jgi:SAM-dependent methyltransferase
MCKGQRLTQFLDLGSMPPADSFLTEAQLGEPEPSYPLRVVVCEDCGLVQLDHVVPPDVLYCHDYPYESSTTRLGRVHWDEFAETAVERLGLGTNDLVVDFGSNVGVLLERFAARGPRVLGIDPAPNIVEIANRRGIETIAAFFNSPTVAGVVAARGKARIVTATNVFAHIDDLDDVMRAVDLLLADDGVLIIEAPYLVNLIERLEYDTIYHEHLSYLAIRPLKRFVESKGMEIFEVQERDIHGGSIRIWIRRRSRGQSPPSDAVRELLALEDHKRVSELTRLNQFADDVARNRRDIRWLIDDITHHGKRVVAVSAPAKGMTLLNYCGLGPDKLAFVTEKAALKIGRFTPGQHIPVVADAELMAQKPDYALLLAWNFADEIIANLRDFSRAGGKFIIPIPSPQIVE